MGSCKHSNNDSSGFINSCIFLKDSHYFGLSRISLLPQVSPAAPHLLRLVGRQARARYVRPVHVGLRADRKAPVQVSPQELRFSPIRMTPPLLRSLLHLSTTDAVQSEPVTGSLRKKLSCVSLSEKIWKGTAWLDMNNDNYLQSFC